MSDDTGIGLFVFNRPEHTHQVLDGLAENDIDHLYVFADGAGPNHKDGPIKTTRNLIRDIDFCDVDVVERSENLGVQRSWVEAYDYIFDRHNRAIMLEDDCVPADDFIQFMRSCLDQYESNHRVMNVHGYSPPIDIPGDYQYDIYFTWRSGSWGQATWKSAWDKLERDPSILEQIKQDFHLRKKVSRAGDDLIPMLRKELRGDIDSIGVWWSLTLAIHGGVSVNPVNSRIKNIGHDGSGSHASKTNRYLTELGSASIDSEFSFPPDVTVHETINRRYNYHIQGRLRGKIGRFLERLRWQMPL
jgi:hypothetical protein